MSKFFCFLLYFSFFVGFSCGNSYLTRYSQKEQKKENQNELNRGTVDSVEGTNSDDAVDPKSEETKSEETKTEESTDPINVTGESTDPTDPVIDSTDTSSELSEFCKNYFASDKSTEEPKSCVKDQECIVNLCGCSFNETGDWKNTDKAKYWKDADVLKGKLDLFWYTAHKGWMCSISGLIADNPEWSQQWPIEEEPLWWCGKVEQPCTCSPEDGCK